VPAKATPPHGEENEGEGESMSAVDNRFEIAVKVTPTQARHIATAIRLDLAARWEEDWLTPFARSEEVSTARSLLDAYADELEMLQWGEPAGDVDLLAERKRLNELATNLLEAGEELVATSDDARAGPAEVRRQGEDMIAAARAISEALADARHDSRLARVGTRPSRRG
jgi:hypothetical protein